MSELVDRARYAYEWGNGDELHVQLAAEVERLEAEVERLRGQVGNRGKWDPSWGSPYDAMGDVP
ncbi:hypothetical protein [Mycobacterium sp. NPDC050853]|uniref:hypothetical protein n=1 Tax=Mycobacterium sp. NPDC050853 TaxID=3155160 RepID=UPI0033C01ADC